MSNAKFCSQCGNKLEPNSRFCSQCRADTRAGTSSLPLTKSDKSGLTAFLLCLFLGTLGVHRFYVGKIGTGILMLITGGGLGLWYLYDLISIVCNNFTDKNGKYVEITRDPSSAKKIFMVVGSIFAGFLILIITFVVLIVLLVGGMADVAQNQFAALREGNIEKAYSYTSQDFQHETSLSSFKKFVNQYPFLKENVKVSFPEREIKNNIGIIRGTVRLKDGTMIPIQMQLIKENNQWKILGIHINPAGATNEEGHSSASDSSSDNTAIKVFENKKLKYTMQYPDSWQYVEPNSQSVAFGPQHATRNSYAAVNVQVVPTKKNRGLYSNTKEAADDLKQQINEKTSDVKYISTGEVELPRNPKKFHGEYFVVTYTFNKHPMKKMQFLLTSDQDQYIYMWAFTATANDYDNNLSVAKSMYESWDIK